MLWCMNRTDSIWWIWECKMTSSFFEMQRFLPWFADWIRSKTWRKTWTSNINKYDLNVFKLNVYLSKDRYCMWSHSIGRSAEMNTLFQAYFSENNWLMWEKWQRWHCWIENKKKMCHSFNDLIAFVSISIGKYRNHIR